MTEERKQRTDVRSQRTEYRKSYWLLVIGLNGVSGVRQFFYLTKPVLDYISFVEFLYNVVRKRRIEIISNNYLAFGRSWFGFSNGTILATGLPDLATITSSPAIT